MLMFPREGRKMAGCIRSTSPSCPTRKRKRCPSSASKKTKKSSVPLTPDIAALHTHVLQIPAGGDVAETVSGFAWGCRGFGVCILSATGPVSVAILWEASLYPKALSFNGYFDLISMSATFLPGGGKGNMAVTLAGPQGKVVGGMVAGPIVAAGTVIITVATFAMPAINIADESHSPSSLVTSSEMIQSPELSLEIQSAALSNSEKGNNKSSQIEKENTRLEGTRPPLLGGGETKEWEINLFKQYCYEIEKYLDLPAEVDDESNANALATEKMGVYSMPLISGDIMAKKWEENIIEQYFDLPIEDLSCGEHFGAVLGFGLQDYSLYH